MSAAAEEASRSSQADPEDRGQDPPVQGVPAPLASGRGRMSILVVDPTMTRMKWWLNQLSSNRLGDRREIDDPSSIMVEMTIGIFWLGNAKAGSCSQTREAASLACRQMQ